MNLQPQPLFIGSPGVKFPCKLHELGEVRLII